MLAQSPSATRDIEACRTHQELRRSGIPSSQIQGDPRACRVKADRGRGDDSTDWSLEECPSDPPLPRGSEPRTRLGAHYVFPASVVIPVAAEYKVRHGIHPHDPGVPPRRLPGCVTRVLGSCDGVKRSHHNGKTNIKPLTISARHRLRTASPARGKEIYDVTATSARAKEDLQRALSQTSEAIAMSSTRTYTTKATSIRQGIQTYKEAAIRTC